MRFVRPILAGLTAMSLVAALSPAFAQRTGSHIRRGTETKDPRQLIDLIAICVVDRRPQMVRAWFNELPGTDSEFKFVLRHEGDLDLCIDNDKLTFRGDRGVEFEPKALRQPLALAYARKALQGISALPSGLSPESAPWFLARYEGLPEGTPVDTSSLVIQDFGHCVASSNWPAARAFLLSSAKSDEERAAVNALKPSLGACLSKDSTVALTTQNLRVALAEPMVHILTASVQEVSK